MRSVLVEACVTSAADADLASRAGAERMELCRELVTGGLTPEVGTLDAVRAVTSLPVFAMVRPVPGPFRASPREVAAMLRELDTLQGAGIDGFVLGLLDERGRLDTGALKELVAAARGPVTFHRAFDEIAEPLRAVEQLQEVGVARVLTSGGAATAWEGRHVLRDLVRAAGDRVAILSWVAVASGATTCSSSWKRRVSRKCTPGPRPSRPSPGHWALPGG